MCSLGLMVGAQDDKVDFGWFLGMNLIPCTLVSLFFILRPFVSAWFDCFVASLSRQGNIFGGSIAMALAWWYCYSYAPPGSLDKSTTSSPAPIGSGPQPSPTSGGEQSPLLELFFPMFHSAFCCFVCLLACCLSIQTGMPIPMSPSKMVTA